MYKSVLYWQTTTCWFVDKDLVTDHEKYFLLITFQWNKLLYDDHNYMNPNVSCLKYVLCLLFYTSYFSSTRVGGGYQYDSNDAFAIDKSSWQGNIVLKKTPLNKYHRDVRW